MKLAFQLAIKNLIGAGLRTWLNVGVLTFSFLIIIFYRGILEGWYQRAKIDTIDWEYGHGQFWHQNYDPYDLFTVKNGHGKVNNNQIKHLTPVLIQQATIYPEGRMMSVLIKGIHANQKTLNLPTKALTGTDNNIPVIIGQRMADAAKLKVGDQVLLRWRDKNGTFDAANITIASIFKTDVPTVDNGQVWIDIEKLWNMTELRDHATILIADKNYNFKNMDGWVFQNQNDLLKDLNDLMEMESINASFLYALLLAIALLAIFDTQVLSIFRRQKEIGTYIALGMTRKQVVSLFTVEGSTYSFFAMIIGCIIGIPLFAYLAKTGIAFPEAQMDMGIAMAKRIFPTFGFPLVASTIALVIVSATIVSFLPSRKISKMNPVDALKGKIQ